MLQLPSFGGGEHPHPQVPFLICSVIITFCIVFFTADQTVEKVSIDKIRFFRVEKSYAVQTGKWYFEFEAVTGGDMRVGWARPGCQPDVELGADDQAFVFQGSKVCLIIIGWVYTA